MSLCSSKLPMMCFHFLCLLLLLLFTGSITAPPVEGRQAQHIQTQSLPTACTNNSHCKNGLADGSSQSSSSGSNGTSNIKNVTISDKETASLPSLNFYSSPKSTNVSSTYSPTATPRQNTEGPSPPLDHKPITSMKTATVQRRKSTLTPSTKPTSSTILTASTKATSSTILTASTKPTSSTPFTTPPSTLSQSAVPPASQSTSPSTAPPSMSPSTAPPASTVPLSATPPSTAPPSTSPSTAPSASTVPLSATPPSTAPPSTSPSTATPASTVPLSATPPSTAPPSTSPSTAPPASTVPLSTAPPEAPTATPAATVNIPSSSHQSTPAPVSPHTAAESHMKPVSSVAGMSVVEAALTRQLVDTASLLAVLLFGLLFFLVTVAVFVTQAYESYRRKDYTQVDYLINGMYTDSGV